MHNSLNSIFDLFVAHLPVRPQHHFPFDLFTCSSALFISFVSFFSIYSNQTIFIRLHHMGCACTVGIRWLQRRRKTVRTLTMKMVARSGVLWTKRYSFSNDENLLKRPTTWMVLLVLWCFCCVYGLAIVRQHCEHTLTHTQNIHARQICRWMENGVYMGSMHDGTRTTQCHRKCYRVDVVSADVVSTAMILCGI